jgi:hypothetical protein
MFFADPDPAGFAAEPLCEWALQDIADCRATPAIGDTYGKCFYYLQQQMILFQTALQAHSVEFFAIAREKREGFAEQLEIMARGIKMDRVEAGDDLNTQPKLTMAAVSSILKHSRESPHATAMGLLIHKNIAGQIEGSGTAQAMEGHYQAEKESQPSITDLDETRITCTRADICRMVHTSYADWPSLAVKEVSVPPFIAERVDGSHASVILNGFAGLRMRRSHCVIRVRWPGYPLGDVQRTLASFPESRARIMAWQASAYPEALQWVEFRKVGDFPHPSQLAGLATQKGQRKFMKRRRVAVSKRVSTLGPVRLLNLRRSLIAMDREVCARLVALLQTRGEP